jgi:hypothetical protein
VASHGTRRRSGSPACIQRAHGDLLQGGIAPRFALRLQRHSCGNGRPNVCPVRTIFPDAHRLNQHPGAGEVCVLCGGPLFQMPQADHWISKSTVPELSVCADNPPPSWRYIGAAKCRPLKTVTGKNRAMVARLIPQPYYTPSRSWLRRSAWSESLGDVDVLTRADAIARPARRP